MVVTRFCWFLCFVASFSSLLVLLLIYYLYPLLFFFFTECSKPSPLGPKPETLPFTMPAYLNVERSTTLARHNGLHPLLFIIHFFFLSKKQKQKNKNRFPCDLIMFVTSYLGFQGDTCFIWWPSDDPQWRTLLFE